MKFIGCKVFAIAYLIQQFNNAVCVSSELWQRRGVYIVDTSRNIYDVVSYDM